MTGVVHALPKGSHILISDDVYGGTSRYMRQYAIEKFGYQVDFVDLTNIEVVKSNLKQNTSIVWIETPTNPLIKLVDIEELIKKVRQTHPNVWILVDNTFATPYLQSPLLMGADITLNSVSKYIGGHSDIIMGAIVCKDKTIHQKIYHASLSFGGCPSPFDCYLALRGLKTLECRVKNHCKNAFSVAKFLEDHPHVESVIYPGLKSHPQHEIAKKQMRGPGGMISFRIKGGLKEANIFLQSFKLVVLAESLGGVETLVEHPAQMTHASIPEDIRAKLGITDNFIRISIGLEDAVDIMEDFNQALEKACGKI
ncbi:hypothetical protein IMG5_168370 [Ichthyophthirius multifiliis]|uniref:cystathionine gamma-lyase n=1 Tax=Ichthyophthirius multifiliis TaxID=5932 RepID=G0R134_ICHMU|nr:hypothetical protein IMG5_168370 [Ichthyophthirius multifiliis]EGR28801.1 hypothetical protein IMG5_168370 [Ichthyophthirius multifiliis]|eukprot:XP_004030037.1 hypothetical protein IMG5_168370 [Ichthyophthirius multifiliis]